MIFLIILAVEAAVMIAIGARHSRRLRGSGDFFVAGRELGAGLLFSTFLAANIGAGSTVGATGLGYRIGLSAFWWVGSAGIGSVVLALWIGPRIWRLARNHNLLTTGDYLELKYNRSVRGFAALLLCCGALAILAGQVIAVAWILNVTAGIGKPAGCIIAALVICAYFISGGLHSTARVNVLQVSVKLAGFALALGFLLAAGKGWSGIAARLAADGGMPELPAYMSLAGIGSLPVLRYVVLIAPSFMISPGLLQKVFGARDERAVRAGVGFNALGLIAFAIVPAMMGIIARLQFPGLANSELALPMLLTRSMPLLLGGLLLGAIFAAELSAADAVLFMLSTSLAKDLYAAYRRPGIGDAQLLKVVRVAAALCGAAGALLAILLPSVIAALTIFYSMLTAAFFLPVIAGLLPVRVSSRTALATMIVTVLITLCLELVSKGQGPWGIPSLAIGLAAGAATMTASTVFRSPQ